MEKKKKNKKKQVTRTLGLIIKIIILLFLIALILLGFVIYQKYGKRVFKMEEEARAIVEASSYDTFKQMETSLIYDVNGSVITRLKGEKDVYYIRYDDIPKEAVDAIVSIEDKKYFRHKGYDVYAIARAGFAYLKNKGVITQGGSTITQQLARNIFLSFEESWQRKAKEIFIAKELEKKYDKKEIMEFYLNNIYFANGYYGIQSAGFGYFGKSVTNLSLSQIAFLLAIPNSPSRYDPYENMEGALGRRDRILAQMKKDGKLSEEDYEKAVAEKIKVKARKRGKSSYLETFSLDQAVKSLMRRDGFKFVNAFPNKALKEKYYEEFNRAYAESQRNLYSGGYRIYTSLDPDKQELLQKTLDEHLSASKEKSENGVFSLQGSAVTIDNETGRVVAIVGGRSQNFLGSTLNRAYQSHRQPGSTIKPLIVYAPAFEQGYNPESIVVDEKIEKGPENADKVFSGKMTVLDAVARSKNTIAWRLFTEISPAKGIGKLLDMNFQSIEDEDYYPAASLGGMSKGVNALELSSAYATLQNGGVYREASCIIRITDALGNVLVDGDLSEEESRTEIYTKEATEKMTACLEAVMLKGTGRRGKLSKMPCAGKTGTTNNAKDLWFAGFTKYYTTAIWVGYDLPKSLSALPFETNPLMIWKDFMESLHQGLEVQKLDSYKPVIKEKEVDENLEEEAENEVEPLPPEEELPEEVEENDSPEPPALEEEGNVEEAEEEIVEEETNPEEVEGGNSPHESVPSETADDVGVEENTGESE